MKSVKIWNNLGIALTSAALLTTGCADKPEKPQADSQEKAAHDMSAMQHGDMGEGGDTGEGAGEGEGASQAIDLSKDDIAYLKQLGLMRGHLLVGYELYKAGHVEHAKTHMKHPKMELYADVEPAFSPRGAAGFADELTALATSVEQEKDQAVVDAAYKNVTDAIAKSEGVAVLTPAQKLQLVSGLLRVAGEEYAIAVVDGKMENAHEYQDAYGFTQICKQIVSNMNTKDAAVADAATKTQAIIEELTPIWPGIVPPDTLDFHASALHGAAAKVELLAIGLQK